MKSFLIAAFGLALASTSINRVAHSQESAPPLCPTTNTAENLNSVDGYCSITPEKYEVKIYEMGMCTADPIVSLVFSKDSCVPTFINSSPVSADMANGNLVTLESQAKLDRPTPGEYSHAYMIIDPIFKLKFSYTLAGVTYYSKDTSTSYSAPRSNTKTVAPSMSFDEKVDTFNYDGGFSPIVSEYPVPGGTMSALLTDIELKAATSSGSVVRIAGTYKPNSKVIIAEDTTGLEVQFIVKNVGGELETESNDNDTVGRFGSGAFTMKFETF